MINVHNPCPPFHSYNKVFGRPREEELSGSFKATIHDPLWMIARQWQFGELQGEDAGSAVFAKVAMNCEHLNSYQPKNGIIGKLDSKIPLEVKVESLYQKMSIQSAYFYGKKFLNKLDQVLASENNYNEGQYKANFIEKAGFVFPEVTKDDDLDVFINGAKQLSETHSVSFLKMLDKKALDAVMLFEMLNSKTDLLQSWRIEQPGGFIYNDHLEAITELTENWIAQVVENFNLPLSSDDNAWVSEKMEYNFSCLSTDAEDNVASKLRTDSYHHGHLNWYAFDSCVNTHKLSSEPNSEVYIEKERIIKEVIPTEASFPGMPISRWWEMEDGTVDLGNMITDDTDMVKIAVAQYSLYYNNDWLCMPFDVPVGVLCDMEGIVVKDTFGVSSFVKPINQHKAFDSDWHMFGLSQVDDEEVVTGQDSRIFIPNSIQHKLESKPLEEVKMLRDETTNTVWAVEKTVKDSMGIGVDGYSVATKLQGVFDDLLNNKSKSNEEDDEHTDENEAVYQKFRLYNQVSENWIPFIPVHVPNQEINREIMLQRASLPRVLKSIAPHPIRPRTEFLRNGLNNDDTQNFPMFIHEEEVPRAGVSLEGKYQLTRWFGGKRILWFGASKKTGKGEGSSGLRFDLLEKND